MNKAVVHVGDFFFQLISKTGINCVTCCTKILTRCGKSSSSRLHFSHHAMPWARFLDFFQARILHSFANFCWFDSNRNYLFICFRSAVSYIHATRIDRRARCHWLLGEGREGVCFLSRAVSLNQTAHNPNGSCSESYKGAGIQVSTCKCSPGYLRRQIHLLRSSSHSLG